MQVLEKHIAFVKDQAFLQDKLAARYAANEWRAARHRHSAAQFRALASDLEAAQSKLNAATRATEEEAANGVVSHGIHLRPEDLEDLPPDILEELSLSDTDKLECEILEVIRNAGGILPLNKILIGLYRKTGAKHKRAALTSRLHRMVSKTRLYTVQDRRGIFSTHPLNDEETRDLNSEQDSDPQEPEVDEISDRHDYSPRSDFGRTSRRRLV